MSKPALKEQALKKWNFDEAEQIFNLPFLELIYTAQTIHRKHFNSSDIQISTLVNIKTGSCPENCSYCPQSAHYNTGLKKQPLMNVEDVIIAAQNAKDAGSTRLCLGAAWRGPSDKDLAVVCKMISEVKKLGLEACATLGLLKEHQAAILKEAGLDYYNHNIDTSPEYYDKIISTRTFADRIETLKFVRDSGMKVCSGGILGMGESNEDRINMLLALANLDEPPESVPFNKLIKIPGTPLQDAKEVDPIDFIRTIALARHLMPRSYLRISAGRQDMSDEFQTLCFMAGINSIHSGEKLLTAPNSTPKRDAKLFEDLGMKN